jgi:hypothetical protein
MADGTSTTYYMHTLDGKPAIWLPDHEYIAFAGGSIVATLVPTLRQIRREQQAAIRSARAAGIAQMHWTDPKRYGYVRVSVP